MEYVSIILFVYIIGFIVASCNYIYGSIYDGKYFEKEGKAAFWCMFLAFPLVLVTIFPFLMFVAMWCVVENIVQNYLKYLENTAKIIQGEVKNMIKA